jgi:predicted transcriptional regulator
MLENGKKEPRFSLIASLATALQTTTESLLEPSPPTRRAQLEIELERYQTRYADLDLPIIKPSTRTSDEVLAHLVGLYRELDTERGLRAATAEEVRRATGQLSRELRDRGGYLEQIESAAGEALRRAGYGGSGPFSSRNLIDLAKALGFELRSVDDIPHSVRAITDLRNRRIYFPQRNELRTRQARKATLQTLARHVLGHAEPVTYTEFLRQRRETAYFAAAVLIPEDGAVEFLEQARRGRDLSVEDLREVFYTSYEMAAHRMTNLLTHHLGIRCHLVVSDEEGIAQKAYENDDVPFPRDSEGVVEAQRLCRQWGARVAFGSDDKFSLHHQFTDTPSATFFCTTHIEADRPVAVTFGIGFEDSRLFRGRETGNHRVSACPGGECCRRPSEDLAARWTGRVVTSARAQARILGLLAADPYPRPDLPEIYEFVERHQS